LVRKALQCGDFAFFGGDDQLAAFVVRDSVALQEAVERAPAFDAEPRLKRAGGVVEPCMDNLGIARRHARADQRLPFDDRHALAGARQRIAAGQADGASADYQGVEITHETTSSLTRRWKSLSEACQRACDARDRLIELKLGLT
jgi:hypothetical protein